MSTGENIAVLKEAYRRWHDTLGGSADHWLELMTDDVQFRSLTNGAATMEFTRPSSCKDDVRRYFSGLAADWKMNFYRIEEYIAQGDRVVALSHVSFEDKKTGKTLETAKADFFRFRAGEVCEFFEFFDTAGAIEAATRK
jgi:uncharacterized protein